MADPKQEAAIRLLYADRVKAHEVLFAHRRPVKSPPFHPDIIHAWHDTGIPFIVTEAFRGAAKSTLAEEDLIIEAQLRCYRNGLIIGANEARAMERLEAIKHEIDSNEMLLAVFGDLKGAVWTGHKIEFSNGTVLQAYGRGQSLRGAKYHDQRPDYVVIDDFEDEETVSTKEQRDKGHRWIYKTLLPALAKTARVRFIGNRLDPDAVIVRLAQDQNWLSQRFPIEHVDPATGERVASWPEMFPLAWIDDKRAEYARQGIAGDFLQEYMCEAEAETAKIFRSDMMRVVPRVRTWEATWCMLDPARTVKKSSALTGFAVWSWVGPKLIVWDAWAKALMPDQMIAALFEADREFRPVVVGVEEDGLEEFIRQPLRTEQVRRGHALPLRGIHAPDDKIGFISGLQPYFNAREVEFAKDLPELKAHLLGVSRSSGAKIDAANALAYALKMRPGSPMYDEFRQDHIVEEGWADADKPLYLCMNGTRVYTTAVLVQYDGGLRVLGDWVDEGEVDDAVPRVIRMARLLAGRRLKVVAPPWHWDRWHGIGLPAALRRLPPDVAEMATSGDPVDGRKELRALLRTQLRGLPAVQVAHAARWTVNGFAGGYARDLTKGAQLAEQPAEGVYKVLFEGLESFAAVIRFADDPEASDANYAYTADGRRYRSAMARRA